MVRVSDRFPDFFFPMAHIHVANRLGVCGSCDSMLDNIDLNDAYARYAKPGGWNGQFLRPRLLILSAAIAYYAASWTDLNDGLLCFSAAADPDMLEVGNGGMAYNEYVVHFSLWAIAKVRARESFPFRAMLTATDESYYWRQSFLTGSPGHRLRRDESLQ